MSSKENTPWWDSVETTNHWAEYRVNDTIVIVGARPDAHTFTKEDYLSVLGWLNVTDRLVKHPLGVNNVWFPWNEDGKPSLECVYGSLKVLNYWINDLKLSKIYLHCDGGTHRAVSIFGFYLEAYHKKNAKSIVENHRLVRRKQLSDPLKYAGSYLKELPLIRAVVEKISSAEDSDYGYSIESFLRDKIGKDKLSQYRWERYVEATIPQALSNFRHDFKTFIKYTLFIHPYKKVSYWIHKKLNTKRGQWLKKNGF